MINIVVIGAGNVGIHLCKAINKAKGLTLKQWYNRSKIQKINSLENIPFINDITNLDNADIYIICVSDSAIENLSNDLQFKNRLVVHTSGSVPMRNLNKKNRRGVFYPLQSFSKETEISFIGGFVLLAFAMFFAIGSAEEVANQKGQSLFDKNEVKNRDGDNT